jgi:hypothetical protein
MKKVQFEKISRNGMSFNFSNGLCVAVIFENEDKRPDLMNCFEELFHCGYTYATVSIFRESLNKVEDLTDFFLNKLSFTTSAIKDAKLFTHLLFEVSRYE